MPPIFSVAPPQSRRPGPHYATIPPSPTQTTAATAPFPPCQSSAPDNLLLRARPRDRSRLSSHLCALVSSTVSPVTSIRSTARRRPPPPNLNHRQNRACAAPSLVPNDRHLLLPDPKLHLKDEGKLPTLFLPRPTPSVRPTLVPSRPTLSVSPTLSPPRPRARLYLFP
uniref:Uncharacterized protein n=1 Tax=Setaria viridis TaxID=4556 RepID=A0A4U6UH12_SETVI|nr:hypothetical protein SEVIR_5G182000v2 [Setaria viridis]